jgi:hypothetical protein
MAPLQPDFEKNRLLPRQAVVLIVMSLVLLWSIAEIVHSYPETFYPRFWDEAVYVMDVSTSGVLLGSYTGAMHYAPAKPGYGFPLAAAVALFGTRGAMLLSSAFWALTIVVIGLTILRRFGAVSGLFALAFLSYSPFFGKYVAEAGPTTMAAFFFALLWVMYDRRRFWVTGLVIGYLALIDLKWIPPVAFSVLIAEAIPDNEHPWRKRLRYMLGAALVACALPAVLTLIHRPFGNHMWHYVIDHSRIAGLEPSGIFGYYLILFGAAPAAIAAGVAYAAGPIRNQLGISGPRAMRSLVHALVFSIVPIAFYSLFGHVKVLRFFAVPFPLLAVPLAVGVGSAASWVEKWTSGRRRASRWAATSGVAALAGAVILVGSDGPARHLRIRSSFPEALNRLAVVAPGGGAVSSYIWPVVHYGWQYPIETHPFTLWGLTRTDQWLAADPILDRVTVENRLFLDPSAGMTPDSFLTTRQQLARPYLDSLFSVPSDFYASDYFLSEQTVGGIRVLRRWRTYRERGPNYTTMYRIDQANLRD